MGYEEFLGGVKTSVEAFRKLEKKPVRIVSHLDSDGLASCSILIRAFEREGIPFSISIVRQLDSSVLDELSREDYKVYFFTDLGSGALSLIQEKLPMRTVFVLDHHKPEDFKPSFFHINPIVYGLDGDREISGAGVTYFFAKALNEENKDMAHIAIVGAIGDIQEKKGFVGLNSYILDDAIEVGKMEVKQGLSMFGMQTRPLHKVLEFSTDPYIPGVTGNEAGAIAFLQELGISIKDKQGYKKLIHLDEEDMKKLVTGIILKRLGSEKNPDDILGPIFILREETEGSPTKDAKEFSTLLNACGRLNKPSYGVGTCLGSKAIRDRAVGLMTDYKGEIIKSLNWFYSNRKTDKVVERSGYVIINAEDNIPERLIGTLTSIISRSNIYDDHTIILSMAHTVDGNTKVSMRMVGFDPNYDLRNIINAIVKRTGGQAGGHRLACGCIIPQEKELEFIDVADEILSKHKFK
ncbi:MAG: DHH family phosphoesterase [Candidatus Nanoarchaeia archaeon]